MTRVLLEDPDGRLPRTHLITDLDENVQLLEDRPRALRGMFLRGNASGDDWLRLYNDLDPEVGTDVPDLLWPLQNTGSGTAEIGVMVHLGMDNVFSVGISAAVTDLQTDGDDTAPGTNLVNLQVE